MEADDAVVKIPIVYPVTDGGDSARNLMSEYLWRPDEAVLYLLHVRPTNAASGHANQNLTLTNFWNRNVLRRYVSRALINSRPHLPGKRGASYGGCEETGGYAHVAATISVLGWPVTDSTDL